MAIDEKKVKDFWNSRANRLGAIPIEALTNLEEDDGLMAEKIEFEKKKVFSKMTLNSEDTVLDLGAGIGNWSIPLAKKSRRVVAVEYIQNLIKIGSESIQRLGIENIEFIHSPAQKFTTKSKFDLIFISGLFVYLNDDDCIELIENIQNYSHENTRIFVRDGSGIGERYEVNDKGSDALNSKYSAIYRTREEYIDLFKKIGFKCTFDENMFPEGHRLNKYPETRLRIYNFVKDLKDEHKKK